MTGRVLIRRVLTTAQHNLDLLAVDTDAFISIAILGEER